MQTEPLPLDSYSTAITALVTLLSLVQYFSALLTIALHRITLFIFYKQPPFWSTG